MSCIISEEVIFNVLLKNDNHRSGHYFTTRVIICLDKCPLDDMPTFSFSSHGKHTVAWTESLHISNRKENICFKTIDKVVKEKSFFLKNYGQVAAGRQW